MTDLKRFLENFCKLEGVRGVILLDSDGKMVECHLEKSADVDSIFELVCSSIATGRDIGENLQKSPLSRSYLEYRDMSLTSEVLASGNILTVVADSGANLGRIRLEIRKNRKAIENLLV